MCKTHEGPHTQESGAALLMVMLFMVLMLILVSAMLLFTKNEIIIAGLQRDGARALECAQSGIEEAVRRLTAGHTVIPKFRLSSDGASDPCVRTSVILEPVGMLGASSSYQEIRSESAVGFATRRLSHLVLTTSGMLPPNIVFGYSLATQGTVDVTAGDLYSSTFVKYKRFPICSASPLPARCRFVSYTYAGWGVRGVNPDDTPWCYKRPCASDAADADEVDKWYPGTRRSMRRGQTIAQVINTGGCSDPTLDSCSDSRKDVPIESVIDFTCPAGKAGTVGDTGAWRSTDRLQDNSGTTPSDAALYGCDGDGLPWTLVRETFEDDSTASPSGEKAVWFKTIVFNDWFNRYFVLDDNASDDGAASTCCIGGYRKKTQAEMDAAGGGESLQTSAGARWGVVPSFPDFDALEASLSASELAAANRYLTGGANLTGDSAPGNTLRLGCFAGDSDSNGMPDMACPGNQSDYAVVWLDNGDYAFRDVGLGTNTTTCLPPNPGTGGNGTLLIDGNMIANSQFEWFGTMFVNGSVERINGNVCVHGGLISRDTVETTGTLTVEAGSGVGSVPLGPVTVVRRAWWER